jgi:hypothetical protein
MMWTPKLNILNVDGCLSEEHTEYSISHKNGDCPTVLLTWRFKAFFKEDLELQHFPMDVQVILHLRHTEYPSKIFKKCLQICCIITWEMEKCCLKYKSRSVSRGFYISNNILTSRRLLYNKNTNKNIILILQSVKYRYDFHPLRE